MEYCFYYCAENQDIKTTIISGKTEKECIEKAFNLHGKTNIYCWNRIN